MLASARDARVGFDVKSSFRVCAKCISHDRVLHQKSLRRDDGDAIAVATIDRDVAQSDVPRSVDVNSVATSFARRSKVILAKSDG